MTEPISRYPLQWPTGWKRTTDADRDWGRQHAEIESLRAKLKALGAAGC